jgi:Rrf2 family protein
LALRQSANYSRVAEMKLSRTASYAVQALMRLAEEETARPVPCSRLAAEGNMPERFLLQILRHLVTRGILQSTRGVEGGYILVRRPDQVSLLDILEAIEGPLDTSLPAGVNLPPDQDAKLREALSRVARASREQMAAIKLSDLAVRKPRAATAC